MRAAQINEYGKQDVLKTVSDSPQPITAADGLVIQVHAASINPADWKIRRGDTQKVKPLSFPAILGGDFAGTVAEIGTDVHGWKIGDTVFGQADFGPHGSFADFTPVSGHKLAKKPAIISFSDAACLPTAGAVAYEAIMETIALRAGQKILIHGGAGGIGSFAIQLAKHVGAYVATTVSHKDLDYAKQLGADEIINYRADDFSQHAPEFDAVLDTVGSNTYTKSFQVVKKGGLVTSLLVRPDEALMQKFGVRAKIQLSDTDSDKLAAVAKLADQGILKVRIARTFDIDEAAAAVAYAEAGGTSGKVVILLNAAQ